MNLVYYLLGAERNKCGRSHRFLCLEERLRAQLQAQDHASLFLVARPQHRCESAHLDIRKHLREGFSRRLESLRLYTKGREAHCLALTPILLWRLCHTLCNTKPRFLLEMCNTIEKHGMQLDLNISALLMGVFCAGCLVAIRWLQLEGAAGVDSRRGGNCRAACA